MLENVKYQGRHYIIVDRIELEGNAAVVLLHEKSINEYDIAGIDTEESMLKFDENIHKTYPNGIEAIHIIDDLSGLGVGYYGIMENDSELEII